MTFDFSIIVNSCDKYKFLWKPFVELFEIYWDKNIDVPKYILGETISENIDGFFFILPGKNIWSDNVIYALNMITTKYVLWLNDDYFLIKTIPKETFEEYFYLIDHYNADKLVIHYPHSELKLIPILKDYGIYRMDQDSPYTTTLQSSLWKAEHFKSCLIKGETPWEFELKGTERLNSQPHMILHHLIDRWYFEAMTKGKFNKEYYDILKFHGKEHLIHTL